MTDLLEVVDESDCVIGHEERTYIHQHGLLHREVHVFITDGVRIALQRRSSGARSWQGFLDASIGGHVEMGETYEAAALHEMYEEAGLTITPSELIPIEKLRIPARDIHNGYHNNVWRMVYGYHIKEGDTLTKEEGKSDGFEWYTLEEIEQRTFVSDKKCIPVIADSLYIRCYRALLFRE